MLKQVILAAILWLALCGMSRANPSWVEGINVLYEKPDSAAFHLQLANRFQVAAVENNVGNHCAVRLQPVFNLEPHQERFAADTLLWEATDTLPLERVNSEWIADQLWVQLAFTRTVSCTFQISADQRSVWVSLKGVDSAETQAIKAQLEKARRALAQGDANTAVALYRAILDRPPHPLQQEALEYLGVALERLQDYTRAAKVYQAYLDQFPKAAGVDRVRQRLEGIQLMKEQPTPTLRKPRQQTARPMQWFGVLSNAYQQYRSDQGMSQWQTLQSTWITDLNLNGRYRGEDIDTKIMVSAGYSHDFENDTLNPERLSNAYLDVYHKATEQQIRVGRQTTNGEGILGRYDGIRYSKSLGTNFTINGVAGYPVYSSRDVNLNTNAQLYGVSLDVTPVESSWKGNLFLTEQTVDGLLDRRAVGGEANYFTTQQSWLTYLDYDINFNELNTVMVNANWFGDNDSHYYLSLDYRRSPTLTLSNALIGQTMTDLGQLANSGLSATDLQEVALDRSAISQSFSAGASRRFHPHFRWALDTSLWKLSGTSSSLGVPGFDGTDLETNLSVQLIGNDLWWDRDLSWLTLRYADLTSSQLYSVTSEIRIPIGTEWRLRPRLQLYQRRFTTFDGSERSVQPQLRVEYQPDRAWNFELDLGAEWLTSDQGGIRVDQMDYLLYLRADWLF